MKKALLILVVLFASLSGNLAQAGSQSYTSPWRPAYYESSGDYMEVNINAYSSLLEFSGGFSPSSSWPASDTYADINAYHSGPSIFYHLYTFIYSAYGSDTRTFCHPIPDTTWYTVLVHMNISNGVGTATVSWY